MGHDQDSKKIVNKPQRVLSDSLAKKESEYTSPEITVHDEKELRRSTMIVHAGSLINP